MTGLPASVGRLRLTWGAASTVIPVRVGADLSGYPFVERPARGSHDPLLASAVVVGEGEQRAVLVIVDLIGVSTRIVAAAREGIERLTGISADRIMIAATHTHSGPAVELGELFDAAIVGNAEAEFDDVVVTAVVEAVSIADRNRAPGSMAASWGTTQPPVGRNRRNPDGPFDPRLPVVALYAESGDLGALLTSIACHPTILPAENHLYSGDLHWGIRAALEERFGADLVTLCATGAAGDQSTRYTRQGSDFAEAERSGRIAADAIARALELLNEQPVLDEPAAIRVSVAPISLPLRELPPVAEADAEIAHLDAALDNLRQVGAPLPAIRSAEVALFGARHTARYARSAVDRPWPDAATSSIQLLAIGPIRLLGIPAELFLDVALAIEASQPDNPPVIVAYSSDLLGYIATERAFHEGGYEVTVGLLGPGAAGQLVRAATDLLAQTEPPQ
jgi:neutral ceramidase